MEILIVLLLGLLQGAIGFFPISTEGIQAIFGKVFGMGDTALLYCVFFHTGTAILFFFYLKKDLLRMPGELIHVLKLLFQRLRGFLLRKLGQTEEIEEAASETNHERFSAMAFLALAAALPVALFLRPLVLKAFGSILLTGIGFLITAVVFLVGGKLKIRSRLPINTRVWYGALAGLLLAAGSFPGISVIGVLFVFATILGFNRQTAQRFAGICYFFSAIGSLPLLLQSGAAGSLTFTDVLIALAGLAATFGAGAFLSARALRAAKMAKGRHMALISFLLGAAAILLGFLIP